MIVLIHAPRNSAFGGITDSLETEIAEDKAEADADEAEAVETEAEADADEAEAEDEEAEDEEANAGNKVISESKIVSIRLLPFINITLLCSKT
ncbi:MAG: hypothetical protein J6Q26_06895 [Bacteroidales bacterium]|nr:hypothetical protein [Bacteroidales bacterium]